MESRCKGDEEEIKETPKWITATTKYLKRRTKPIKWIILHHSGGHKGGDLLTLQGLTSKKASSDFYVDKKGQIYKLNPQLTLFYTYHAGVSKFGGLSDLNRYTIGIETEHLPGEVWTEAQVKSIAEIAAWCLESASISTGLAPDYIHSHKEVAWPRGRKVDPENFPWRKLSEYVAAYRRK